MTAYIGGFSNAATVDTGMGILLIDAKMDVGPLTPSTALRQTLEDRGEHVRWIAITHPHVDHVDGLAKFADDPEVEEIVGAPLDAAFALPDAAKFVPVSAAETRRFGGVEARLLPFPHAHTGGDLALWFPGSRVAIVGDLVVCGYFPHAEYENGGSYQGLLAAVRSIQELRPAFVIGGHGGVCTGDDLDRYVTTLEAAINHGVAESPPRYESMRVPFRTISSQSKLVRCGQLEREQGPWSQVPDVDRDQTSLSNDLRHCR